MCIWVQKVEVWMVVSRHCPTRPHPDHSVAPAHHILFPLRRAMSCGGCELRSGRLDHFLRQMLQLPTPHTLPYHPQVVFIYPVLFTGSIFVDWLRMIGVWCGFRYQKTQLSHNFQLHEFHCFIQNVDVVVLAWISSNLDFWYCCFDYFTSYTLPPSVIDRFTYG